MLMSLEKNTATVVQPKMFVIDQYEMGYEGVELLEIEVQVITKS